MEERVIDVTSNWRETVKKADTVMSNIVARGVQFNSSYQAVMAKIPNNENGIVGWNFLSIINVYRGLPIIVLGWGLPKFVNHKHYDLVKIWNPIKWYQLKKDKEVLKFDFTNLEETDFVLSHANPFRGIAVEDIKLIANTLYIKKEEN